MFEDLRFCRRCGNRIAQFGPDSVQASLAATLGSSPHVCQCCAITDRLSGAIRQLDRSSTLVGEVLVWLHGLWLLLLSVNTYVAERQQLVQQRQDEQRIEATDAAESEDEEELLRGLHLP